MKSKRSGPISDHYLLQRLHRTIKSASATGVVGSDDRSTGSGHDLSLEISVVIIEDEVEPTSEEIRTLHHVPDSLPVSAWFIAIVELCKRFTFYGCIGVFRNYSQQPLDGSLGHGALGIRLIAHCRWI